MYNNQSASPFSPIGNATNAYPIVTPKSFGALGGGADDTAAVQAAINFAVTNYPVNLDLTGSWSVTSLIISGGNGLILSGISTIIGIANSAQNAVIESTMPGIVTNGQIKVVGNYSANYVCGWWHHSNTAAQFCYFNNIFFNGCQVGFIFGDANHASALISEISVYGGGAYGCPVCFIFYGAETYIQVIGGQWSANDFGGNGGWQAKTKRVAYVIGSFVDFTGCELIQTQTNTMTSIESQPITGTNGEGVQWPQVSCYNCFIESAYQFWQSQNPNALVINPTYKNRGLIRVNGCSGFFSTGSAAVLAAFDFDGNIDVKSNSLWSPNARTTVQVFCSNTKTDVYLDSISFDPSQGWQDYLQSVSSGVLHFPLKQIVAISGLAPAGVGQVFPANTATDLLFQNASNSGLTNRFNPAYNSATGEFTIPTGGLNDVTMSVSVRCQAALTADLIIKLNTGGGYADSAYNTCGVDGQVIASWPTLAAGTKIKATLNTYGGTSGAASLTNAINTFSIDASR